MGGEGDTYFQQLAVLETARQRKKKTTPKKERLRLEQVHSHYGRRVSHLTRGNTQIKRGVNTGPVQTWC